MANEGKDASRRRITQRTLSSSPHSSSKFCLTSKMIQHSRHLLPPNFRSTPSQLQMCKGRLRITKHPSFLANETVSKERPLAMDDNFGVKSKRYDMFWHKYRSTLDYIEATGHIFSPDYCSYDGCTSEHPVKSPLSVERRAYGAGMSLRLITI